MSNGEKERPVHEYRLGRVVGTVWYNENGSGRGWHNVQIVRLYRDDDGNWQRSQGFGRDDLPLVMKVADALHTWIHDTWKDRDKNAESEPAPKEASAAA